MQVYGIWNKSHLAYNKFMGSLVPREIYYRLQRLLRTDVMDLIEECDTALSNPWEIGRAVREDEAVVPHTGGRCLGLRQYIACKPHSIGILADNGGGGGGYVFNCNPFVVAHVSQKKRKKQNEMLQNLGSQYKTSCGISSEHNGSSWAR